MVPETSRKKALACGRCGTHTSEDYSRSSSVELVNSLLGASHFTRICRNCMDDLESLVHNASATSIDQPGDELIEGTHFYMENGLVVFTELYHVAKGYCCKSGCRHCAYGYKPEI